MVTDVAMPGMSGVELACKTRELYPELPILFASGYADLEMFGDQLNEEVVMKKPYRLAELAARVHALAASQTPANVVPIRP
jgi:FixJ family two-component response regulator